MDLPGAGAAVSMETAFEHALVTLPGRRLRVLVLVTRSQRRGAELFAATLSEGLTQLGVEVRLRALCPAPDGSVEEITTLGREPYTLSTLRALRQEMRTVDVVVAAGSKTLPASVIASLGFPRALIYQNIGDPFYWAPSRRRRIRHRLMLGRAAAVAAVSEGAARALSSGFGVPTERVIVLPNARDSERFRPATEAARTDARARLGLSPDDLVVTAVGALSPEKRLDVAISAVGLLPPAVRLLLVGWGPERAHLEAVAARTAPRGVRFLGSRADVEPVYAASDVALLTSDSEGVPGALIEAGLCGVPAVATDVGYVSDVVVHGRTGLLVPPRDAPAVARALTEVIDRRDAMAVAARAHCEERFDLGRVTRQWADLIRSVDQLTSGGRRVAAQD